MWCPAFTHVAMRPYAPCGSVQILPFDLLADYSELEKAAAAADAAFGGKGIDYLIHNAGGWCRRRGVQRVGRRWGTDRALLYSRVEPICSCISPSCPAAMPPPPNVLRSPGASQHALASETSAQVTDELMALNAVGPIKLTRAVLPYMLRRDHGRIVVVGSMSSKLPSPGQVGGAGKRERVFQSQISCTRIRGVRKAARRGGERTRGLLILTGANG